MSGDGPRPACDSQGVTLAPHDVVTWGASRGVVTTVGYRHVAVACQRRVEVIPASSVTIVQHGFRADG